MAGQSRGQVMDKIRNHKHIEDIEVIGSGAFSYWRGLTHWDYMYNLGPEECGIFYAYCVGSRNYLVGNKNSTSGLVLQPQVVRIFI